MSLPIRLAALLVGLPLASQGAPEPATAPLRYLIPSWGDMAIVYGPGTRAAMDSPQAIEAMLGHWRERGFTGVFLRSDLGQFPPGAIHRNSPRRQDNPALARSWQLLDGLMAACDLHGASAVAARRVGIEYWIYHPHLFSEGAPEEAGVAGLGRMIPWSYELAYLRDHPEALVVDRAGNKQWMVPEYTDAGMRAHKAAEFAHLARTYHPTGILASLRSETNQLIPPPDHADQYGFGPSVVAAMREKFGVDILTDARFDFRAPGFDPQAEILGHWRDLRGAGFTQLLREIRAAMRQADAQVKLGITLPGDFMGPPLGNARLDWRTWVDEGLVDLIVTGASLEATYDPRANKKGYLTHARAGLGTISAEQLKEYIRRSAHPNIQVIQPGAPPYFETAPPTGADGWQCDAWYDSYHDAVAERWRQWQADIRELGAIRFIAQDFDGFEPGKSEAAGGLGDGRHAPNLRACPGFWYTLSDGSNPRPFIQANTRRGNHGNAVSLTRRDLTAVHFSAPDRSQLAGQLDTAITTGTATMTCWVNRPSSGNSLTIYLTGTGSYEKDVAVRIGADGGVSHARGGEWVASAARVRAGVWTKVTLRADLEAGQYAAELGGDGESLEVICAAVPYAAAGERSVTQHGVESVEVKVPGWRFFNALIFLPAEDGSEPVHLDDVLLTWTPATPGVRPTGPPRLSETFEDAPPGCTSFPGKPWQVVATAAGAAPFSIERGTSFGPGTRCLRASGGGQLRVPLGQLGRGPLAVDLDVFLRSGKSAPILMPDPAPRTPHPVTFTLRDAGGQPIAVLRAAEDGTWHLGEQSMASTGRLLTLDGWAHLQFVIDPQARHLRVVSQPVGEAPRLVGTLALDRLPAAPLELAIEPAAGPRHLSCYDNLLVTSP